MTLRLTSKPVDAQMERTAAATQQAVDFKPLDDSLPETGPTLTCSLLAPMVAALGRAAAAHLQGANAESFTAEVLPPSYQASHPCTCIAAASPNLWMPLETHSRAACWLQPPNAAVIPTCHA